MEWSIALPPRPGHETKPDWTVAQKAWWDAILLMEANPGVIRITLEMRIVGGSSVLLAPQRGNDLGTVVIEVLTTLNTPTNDWVEFCQKLVKKWLHYTDASTGKPLRARPHWSKQWEYLMLPDDSGKLITAPEWFRKVAYKDEIPLFLNALQKVGEGAEFTVDDLRARFANRRLEGIFWGTPDPTIESKQNRHGVVNKLKAFCCTIS